MTEQGRKGAAAWRALCWSLAGLPACYLAAMLAKYHLDAPWLDQWEFIPFLAKSYEGTLTFGDFWAQHNEHRLVFPRLIMLVLARASHWNIAWELATSAVLGAGLFGVIVWQVVRTGRRLGPMGADALVPLLSLLVFSLSQWRNWFLGWQLQEFLNVLAAAGGLVLLCHPAGGWPRLIAAWALGLVATYSFANGLVFWPVGLVALVLAASGPRRLNAIRAGVWLALGTLVTASFLWGHEIPGHHPSLGLVFQHPLEYLLYVLKYLGAPVASFHGTLAAVAGLGALVVFCAFALSLFARRGALAKDLAPYVCFGLYAIASAAVTGVGRLGFGTEQAMSPRYVTFSSLLWVALIVFVYAALARQWPHVKSFAAKAAVCAAALCLALDLAANSAYGSLKWTERYRHMLPAQAELESGNDPGLLQRLHPDPELVIERRPVLRKHGLTVFRK